MLAKSLMLRSPTPPSTLGSTALGREAIARGELAFFVMAGGMATRMGGVVKALVEALPGKTFLDLRLARERASLSALAGRPVPLWLMTSDATDGPTRDALAEGATRRPTCRPSSRG